MSRQMFPYNANSIKRVAKSLAAAMVSGHMHVYVQIQQQSRQDTCVKTQYAEAGVLTLGSRSAPSPQLSQAPCIFSQSGGCPPHGSTAAFSPLLAWPLRDTLILKLGSCRPTSAVHQTDRTHKICKTHHHAVARLNASLSPLSLPPSLSTIMSRIGLAPLLVP